MGLSQTPQALVPAAFTAGSMTLLSTTSLSGTTVTISSISQSYKHLYFEVFGCTSTTANGSYRVSMGGAKGRGFSDNDALNANLNPIQLGAGSEPLRTNADNFWGITIFDYASTANFKGFIISGAWTDTGSVTRGGFVAGGCPTNTAISSLVFTQGSGHSYSTGTVRIYGVN